MAQSYSSGSSTSTKKRIKVHRRPSVTSLHNTDDPLDEDFVPLAFKDSEWVGLTFYNPHFVPKVGDEESDEEEIQVMNVDEEEDLPIYNLFPKLRETFPQNKSFTNTNQSTSDITKMLVGQTANFNYMKKSKKLTPLKLSLPSLKEILNEETLEENAIACTSQKTTKSLSKIHNKNLSSHESYFQLQ